MLLKIITWPIVFCNDGDLTHLVTFSLEYLMQWNSLNIKLDDMQ